MRYLFGGNPTFKAAISDQVGVFYHELHFGPVNREIFNNFMTSLEAMIGDFPVVFVMDNDPIHSSIPETYPTMQFKYLPPYSPFLNPIENTFSVLKNYTKQHLHAVAGAPTPSGVTLNGSKQKVYRRTIA